MPVNRSANADLRQEVVQAAIAEMRRVGRARFKVATVAAEFSDRGVHGATLYRWIAAANESGQIESVLVKDVKRAAKRRADKSTIPALEMGVELVKQLPSLANIDDVAGCGPVRVIDYLHRCIGTAELVMKHAKGEDGKPKMTKTLLAASEHLRRCLETAHRIVEQMTAIDRVEDFHRQMIEEVRAESPLCAERIFQRLDHFTRGRVL